MMNGRRLARDVDHSDARPRSGGSRLCPRGKERSRGRPRLLLKAIRMRSTELPSGFAPYGRAGPCRLRA